MSDLFYQMQAEVFAARKQPPAAKTAPEPPAKITAWEVWAYHARNRYWSRRDIGHGAAPSVFFLTREKAEEVAARLSNEWSDVHIVAVPLGPVTSTNGSA